MTADTDVSIVPEQFMPAIVTRAAGYGLTTKGQVLQGTQLQAQADAILQAAIAADEQARAGDLPAGERPTFPQQASGGNPAQTAPRMTPYGYGQS
jgi:hypothetical protein